MKPFKEGDVVIFYKNDYTEEGYEFDEDGAMQGYLDNQTPLVVVTFSADTKLVRCKEASVGDSIFFFHKDDLNLYKEETPDDALLNQLLGGDVQ